MIPAIQSDGPHFNTTNQTTKNRRPHGLRSSYSHKTNSTSPEPVEVTVSVGLDDLGAGDDFEDCLGLVVGVELGDLDAGSSLEYYELDKVLLDHGVSNGSYGYADQVAFAADHGNVLLDGGVNGGGDEFFHLLSAAHHGHAGVDDLDDDISTVLTTIQFDFHSESPSRF